MDEDENESQSLETAIETTSADSFESASDPTELDSYEGCSHYKRKCKLICPDCQETTECRLCHEEKSLQHKLDRFKITEIVCGLCDTRQDCSNECSSCHVQFSKYYCDTCHLWDSEYEKKGVWHCDKCGICRQGGKKKFYHCDTCGGCFATSQRSTHRCIDGALRDNCAICTETVFDAVIPVCVLKCGHAIHRDCFASYVKSLVETCRPRICPLCLAAM